MDQRNRDTEAIDPQGAEDRRHTDRRHSAVGALRPGGVERRRSSRRHIAGAGLLAALALGGVRYQQQRMEPMDDVSMDRSVPEELLLDDVESEGDGEEVDPLRAALEPIIQEAAALHGVDADLVKAVIQTESRFDPRAQSGAGARGLMQLMPRTARSVGIDDPFDPRQNIFGGTKYLSQMLQRYNGNTALALAAYNAGPGNVRRHKGVPPFRETRGYVSKIAKLVADSDAAFSVPAYRAPVKKKARVSARAKKRAATVRKASVSSRAKARRASASSRAKTASARKKATVKRASTAKARKAATRRASRT